MATRRGRGILISMAVFLAFAAPAAVAGAPDGLPRFSSVTIDAPAPEAEPGARPSPLAGGFGERLTTLGDVNRDRVADLLVSHISKDVDGLTGAGRVYVFSGRTRRVVHTIDHPEPQQGAQFGFWTANLDDIDGDRRSDFAVSAPSQDVGGVDGQGRIYVFSGRRGNLLRTIDHPEPQAGSDFGGNLTALGNLNGDRRTDLVVTASGQDQGTLTRAGSAYAFDAATGRLLWEAENPQPQEQARFGFGAMAPGDVNDDRIADFHIGEPFFDLPGLINVGRAVIVSGRDGSALLTIDHPDPHPGARFGQLDGQPGTPGDVTRDGRADIYASGFRQDVGDFQAVGRGYLFSGSDGSLIRHIDDPNPTAGAQFGNTFADGHDLDNNGLPDLLIGENPHAIRDQPNIGGAHVYGGRGIGKRLKTFRHPDAQQNSRFGWTLASPGDTNGDSHPDYWIAAPSQDVGDNVNQGRIYVFQSRDRARPRIPSVRGPRTVSDRARLRILVSDFNNADDELSIRCAFDSRRLHRCGSRVAKTLSRGNHLFYVQALDPAGNRSRIARVVVTVR